MFPEIVTLSEMLMVSGSAEMVMMLDPLSGIDVTAIKYGDAGAVAGLYAAFELESIALI